MHKRPNRQQARWRRGNGQLKSLVRGPGRVWLGWGVVTLYGVVSRGLLGKGTLAKQLENGDGMSQPLPGRPESRRVPVWVNPEGERDAGVEGGQAVLRVQSK